MRVAIQKLSKEVNDLSYAHPGDAGVDLYASETLTLKKGEIAVVGTGIKIAIPKGYEAQVRPKSGLAANFGVTVLNTPGTVDAGYRGEVKVILINLGKKQYKVEKGKKIAQMVFSKIEEAQFIETDSLDETTRNTGGFGSTGLE